MVFLLLVVLVVALLMSLSGLRGRVALLEAAITMSTTKEELRSRLGDLERRLAQLEAMTMARVAIVPFRAEVPPPLAETVVVLETPEVLVAAGAIEVDAVPEPAEVMPAGVFDPLADVGEPVSSVADSLPAVEALPAAVSHEAPVPIAAPATVAEPADSWEVVVGTSWLNKIGVLTFVTGLALLLGYSMVHVGPAGRVAIGFTLGAAMLGLGAAVERQPAYRAYGHGLVAGGWAGLYVTAFAMRAIPAAQVIQSDLVGGLALLLVAGAMVVHSLRYQSQTVTALAYAAAYIPLVLTPLSTFSLVAAIPLAASLLFVAQRFGWSGISLFGLASTYGIFALRGHVLPGVVDAARLMPYVLLATYWVTFEVADILAQRRRRAATDPPAAPLFVTNAAGYLGCVLLTLPPSDPSLASYVAGFSAAGYLISAVLRARLLDRGAGGGEVRYAATVHGAVALTAGLAAWAIDIRFAGPRQTVAFLLETELLVASGLTLADRNIRRVGTAVAGLTTLHALAAGWQGGATLTAPWSMSVWTPVVAIVAAAWYFNREWTRRRSVAIDPVEYLYSWLASLFVALIVRQEVAPPYWGLAGLISAMLLLRVGARQGAEYRYQSYVVLLASIATIVFRFALAPGLTTQRDVWVVLPASIVLAYAYAWWATRSAGETTKNETDVAGAVASSAAAFFIALLEWRVVPPVWLGATWTTTATLLVAVGAWRRVAGLRWQGYALAVFGAVNVTAPLVVAAPEGWPGIIAAAMTIAGLYTAGYVGRHATLNEPEAAADAERIAAGFLPFIATPLLALFKWRVLPEIMVAPAWATSALILAGLGRWRDRVGQRWQGYGIAALATLQAIAWTMPQISRAKTSGDPWLQLAAAAALVIAAGYLVSHFGRRRAPGSEGPDSSSRQLEDVAALAIAAVTTAALLNLEYVWAGQTAVAAVWAATAGALLWVGFARRTGDLRVQAYVMFGLAAAGSRVAIRADGTVATVSTLATIVVLYAASLASRAPIRAALARGAATVAVESQARVVLSVVATFLLTGWIAIDAAANLVTMGWGLEGIVLLVVGFAARDRSLRLAGLGLLFLCILKLFIYDLRELQALGRIISFVVLGLVLLGVSWTYTRYREEIRRFL